MTFMNEVLAVHTDRTDVGAAAAHLVEQVNAGMGGAPDVLVVFASAAFDYEVLLEALQAGCHPALMMGASSAGEFTHASRGTGTVSALAIRSDEIKFAVALGTGISSDARGAARALAAGFKGLEGQDRYRAALVLTDALAGHAESLVDELTLVTSGRYQLAGGGAGDDAQFSRTHVFHGTRSYSDAVVALEILSDKPIGVGVGHGWVPTGKPMLATEVDGMRLVGLNGLPAADAFEAHAEATGQAFDRADPMPFFLHNILGVDTGEGYRLRVPLAVNDDGSVALAAEIQEYASVSIMRTTADSASEAAARATTAAMQALESHPPGAALFFDCVATRLRLGDAFAIELRSVCDALAGAPLVGCNTYGQIARAQGQFSGFHNCTAVVLVLPD
jgi:hypothetical protein